MAERERIANIDMDGTVADYDRAICRGMSAVQSPEETPFILADIAPEGELPSYIEERMRLIKSQVGWWRNLAPLPLGMAILEEIRKEGYSLNILTKGPRNNAQAWSEKVLWIAEHIPDAHVTIVSKDKGLTYGRLLFDDWPPYIERWLTWRPRGKVLMLDHHYNQSFNHPQVLRVKGSEDLPDVVKFLQDSLADE